ncbi:MAG: nucleotidyltransferase domain-containing protein [Phycisphaerae bacterium]|nr:nucleotidyltransferase domain-containing protein [Phycisphaerae bacterium]
MFGSASSGGFDRARSDVDFLVEFGEIPRGRRFDTYFELREALSELGGRPVDLVEAGASRTPNVLRRLNES